MSRALRAALLLAIAALLCAARSWALQLPDDRGRAIAFDQPPRRIVSLLPSLTETVCALQACERLVGTDRYSDWPASIARLPKVGGGLDPDLEAIVRLHPDLVLLGTDSRAAARLEALGLKVFAVEAQTYADVRRVTRRVAAILGAAGADRLWAQTQEQVAQAAATLPPRARALRVYFEVSGELYAAGAGSFIGDTLARLGAVNIVPASLGPFPKLNPEFVVRAAPDVIMETQREATDFSRRPGWSALRAVREHRICAFDRGRAAVLLHPGPRIGEAARLLADCLREQAP